MSTRYKRTDWVRRMEDFSSGCSSGLRLGQCLIAGILAIFTGISRLLPVTRWLSVTLSPNLRGVPSCAVPSGVGAFRWRLFVNRLFERLTPAGVPVISTVWASSLKLKSWFKKCSAKQVIVGLTFCFVTSFVTAATVLDLRRELPSVIDEFQQQQSSSIPSLGGFGGGFGFAPIKENELRLVHEQADDSGIVHRKYAQYFLEMPVWGKRVVTHSYENSVLHMSGTLVNGISSDFQATIPTTKVLDALEKVKTILESQDNASYQYEDQRANLLVYVDENQVAKLVYEISFFVVGTEPKYPIFIMDAMTGEVLKQWDGLTHTSVGTGPGGNTKTSPYNYGTASMDFLDVRQSGTSCIMETGNVKTIDLQHSWDHTIPDSAYNYTCFNNTHKSINGGYAPLNDAHFFANKVMDMYQDWHGISLSSLFGGKLRVKVHMGNGYENAFWVPSALPPRIVFGDGASYFYPLMSLDVVSHEIAHGFTNYNSELIYNGQSGGINEAFSDMAGEAAEFYLTSSNDWFVGADIAKSALGNALRYMSDPTLDNSQLFGGSIGHASNYFSGMDVHHSSGVFNKAFYLLANKPGWNTKTAFDVMVDANRYEWIPSSDFEDAACGAEFTALNRGYDFRDVHDAFYQVGVSCSDYPYYSLYLNGNDNPPTGGGVQGATDNFPRETAANIGGNYYSGPPTAKATLSYITGASVYQTTYGGSSYTGTQNDIYAHHALNDGNDMTADELMEAVNSIVFDPYYVAPSYDYPYHYGQIEEADEMDALKKIVYWADYLPGGGRHGPVMVPTFANLNSNTWGANNHWKVIRGIVTTLTSATGHGGPYKTNEQSQLTSIDVIGFLVNDPMLPVNDLGYYTYQSATDFQVDYHLIDSKYRAVLEPPINRKEAEAALDNVELSIAKPIENDKLRDALSIQQDTRKRRTTRDGRQRDDLVAIVRDTVIPGSLILDPVFNPIIKAVKHARTFTVDDLDTGKPYVVIALGPESNDKATVLVQVNPDNGTFLRATWDENEQGQRYPKVSAAQAEQVAKQSASEGSVVESVRPVWSSKLETSTFYFSYEVTLKSGEVVHTNSKGEIKTVEATPYNASGTILDKQGNPVAGTTVQVGDKTAVTDETGHWELIGLIEGKYTVNASKEGYTFEPAQVNLTGNETSLQVTLTVLTEPVSYRASGTLRDKEGNPLPGVTIQIGDKTTTTDTTGYWEINGLAEGEYTVIASKAGYRFDSKPCVVSDNEKGCQPALKLEPVLDIKVVPEPRIAKQGENVTYSITVTNQGDETATGVTLADVLPDNTDLVTIESLEGGPCESETVRCSLPDLTPGATANVKVVISNRQAKTLINTVTVNTQEYPTDVKKTWTRVIPYLSVSVTDQPDPIEMLKVLHYSVAVDLSHYAPTDATGVTLVSQLPIGVELKSLNSDYALCDSSAFPKITCQFNDLSIASPDSVSQATVEMEVELKDAGLLLLTHEAKVTANEYPAHLVRERTTIFIPDGIQVDLALVIDVTGSMQEEINGVIKALKAFIAEMDTRTAPLMALLTFGDDVKVAAFTRDMAVLRGAIEDLTASGGGLCEEASVEALLVAIPHTKASGDILFATDASPYDDADVEKVMTLLRGKGIRFNAMITGDCSKQDSWNNLP